MAKRKGKSVVYMATLDGRPAVWDQAEERFGYAGDKPASAATLFNNLDNLLRANALSDHYYNYNKEHHFVCVEPS